MKIISQEYHFSQDHFEYVQAIIAYDDDVLRIKLSSKISTMIYNHSLKPLLLLVEFFKAILLIMQLTKN